MNILFQWQHHIGLLIIDNYLYFFIPCNFTRVFFFSRFPSAYINISIDINNSTFHSCFVRLWNNRKRKELVIRYRELKKEISSFFPAIITIDESILFNILVKEKTMSEKIVSNNMFTMIYLFKILSSFFINICFNFIIDVNCRQSLFKIIDWYLL